MSVVGECLVAFIFGSAVGLLVQRSRFCNTAALRDALYAIPISAKLAVTVASRPR